MIAQRHTYVTKKSSALLHVLLRCLSGYEYIKCSVSFVIVNFYNELKKILVFVSHRAKNGPCNVPFGLLINHTDVNIILWMDKKKIVFFLHFRATKAECAYCCMCIYEVCLESSLPSITTPILAEKKKASTKGKN